MLTSPDRRFLPVQKGQGTPTPPLLRRLPSTEPAQRELRRRSWRLHRTGQDKPVKPACEKGPDGSSYILKPPPGSDLCWTLALSEIGPVVSWTSSSPWEGSQRPLLAAPGNCPRPRAQQSQVSPTGGKPSTSRAEETPRNNGREKGHHVSLCSVGTNSLSSQNKCKTRDQTKCFPRGSFVPGEGVS